MLQLKTRVDWLFSLVDLVGWLFFFLLIEQIDLLKIFIILKWQSPSYFMRFVAHLCSLELPLCMKSATIYAWFITSICIVSIWLGKIMAGFGARKFPIAYFISGGCVLHFIPLNSISRTFLYAIFFFSNWINIV